MRPYRFRRLFLIPVFIVFVAALVAPVRAVVAGTQPIVTTDLLRFRQATSIDVSRTGAIAVASISSIETEHPKLDDVLPGAAIEPIYHKRSHLLLYDLRNANAQPRQLTWGERYDTNPQLSPDGKLIAFERMAAAPTGANADDLKSQIWILPVDGGEARQLTNLEHGAGNPVWSPDGRSIMVTSNIPIYELPGKPSWAWDRPARAYNDVDPSAQPNLNPAGSREEIRAWLEANAREANPVVVHRLHFQEEHGLKDAMQFAQLFTIDAFADGAEPRQITNGFADHHSPAFTPDGRWIVYSRKKDTGQHPDRVLEEEIRRVNADGSNDQLLLSMEGWSLQNPKPSRDGNLIAFVGQQQDNPAYRPERLGIASIENIGAAAASGDGENTMPELVWLTDMPGFDAEAWDFRWMSSGPGILFRTARMGHYSLMQASPALLEPAPYIELNTKTFFGVGAYDTDGGVVVYSATEPGNPCVLRVKNATGEDRLLADLNPWVAEKRLSIPQEKWLERPDGRKIHYWVMEPTNRQPNKTYPLCLEMHGGPMVMWSPGEFTMWHEFQLLCSWGYGVVYANPRGSAGYGEAFQRGNEQNWGDGPAGDVLAAVDACLLEPWVDPERLVVTGGSYAGYLTAWIVGHDHRFKAAVAQRGVYDLDTFFGEGNAWELVPWCFGGYPWDARAKPVLQRESPFTYVNRIRTPLLIIHASNDLRTGVSQSEMMFRALAVQGKPVEYVRYPDAGHDLSRTGDPKQRLDRLNRIIEFFERYIKNDRAAPAETPSGN